MISEEEIKELKTKHGRVVYFKSDDLTLYYKMPSDKDLTMVRSSASEETRREDFAAVAKRNCIHPSDAEVRRIYRDKVGLPYAHGALLLKKAGFNATIRVLDENEIEDDAMAEAYVKHAGPKVHAVILDCAPHKLPFILKEPVQSQLTEYYANSNDSEACRTLLRKMVLFGDIDAMSQPLPAGHITLLEFLLAKSGLTLEAVEGEA